MKGSIVPITILIGVLVWFAAPGWGQPSVPTVGHLETCEGPMLSPSRLFYDQDGNVLTTDPRTGSLLTFSYQGDYLGSRWIGGEPTGIVRDGSGVTYIADSAARHVRRFSSNWQELSPIGEGDFQEPNDIAFHLATGRVYITDSTANVVRVYSATTAAPLFTFGSFGNADGQFYYPTGICADPWRDEVLVCDHNNGRVQIFDLDGNFVTKFGRRGGGWERFTRILGIDVDIEGRIYVVDSYQGSVHIALRDGTWQEMAGEFGKEPGQLTTPTDAVIDPFGRMWVTSTNTSRIEVFSIDPLYVIPPTPTITPTPSSTATPSPTPTWTLSPTVTLTPTVTPTMPPPTPTVCVPEDVNQDLTVNVLDLRIVTRSYFREPSDPDYDPRADVNADGTVDFRDLMLVNRSFGVTCDPVGKAWATFMSQGLPVLHPTASETTVPAGELVRIDLVIENVTDMAGYQCSLLYDPSVLEFVDLLEGTFLGVYPDTTPAYLAPITTTPGVIGHLAAASFDLTGHSGSGVLFSLFFQVKSEQATVISLNDVLVAGEAHVPPPSPDPVIEIPVWTERLVLNQSTGVEHWDIYR